MRYPRGSVLLAAVCGVLSLFIGQPALALFNSMILDPSFCNTKAVRQTVVYIDDSMMIEGRTAWAGEVVRKLRASLAPGEKTTVVQLSPVSGTSSEVWSGCWPEYTLAQRASIKKNGPYLFTKDPLAALDDQKGYFARDLNAAVSKIYFQTKRPAGGSGAASSTRTKKQLLRALASDEGRFSSSAVTVRAIIYSDMAENSDLGSVYQPVKADEWINYAKELGTHLRKSVFYVFGAGSSDGSAQMENAKAFWVHALRSMSATIGGFGSDLNVPNGIPVEAWEFDTTLKEGPQDFSGKLSLLVDSDGNLIDSWIGFSRLSIAGITGTFRCANSGCRLDASTTSALTTDHFTEALGLSGSRDELHGTLGVPGSNAMFPVTATPPGGEQP